MTILGSKEKDGIASSRHFLQAVSVQDLFTRLLKQLTSERDKFVPNSACDTTCEPAKRSLGQSLNTEPYTLKLCLP